MAIGNRLTKVPLKTNKHRKHSLDLHSFVAVCGRSLFLDLATITSARVRSRKLPTLINLLWVDDFGLGFNWYLQ